MIAILLRRLKIVVVKPNCKRQREVALKKKMYAFITSCVKYPVVFSSKIILFFLQDDQTSYDAYISPSLCFNISIILSKDPKLIASPPTVNRERMKDR